MRCRPGGYSCRNSRDRRETGRRFHRGTCGRVMVAESCCPLWLASVMVGFRIGMRWHRGKPANYTPPAPVTAPHPLAPPQPRRWPNADADTEFLPQLQDLRHPSRPTPIRKPPWIDRHRPPGRSPSSRVRTARGCSLSHVATLTLQLSPHSGTIADIMAWNRFPWVG